MPRQVHIASGKVNVELPDGLNGRKAGDAVTLTEEQFGRVDQRVLGTYVIDDGVIDDYAGVLVKIQSGKSNVVLPNGLTYSDPDQIYLSPKLFAQIPISAFTSYLTNIDDKIAFFEMPIQLSSLANGALPAPLWKMPWAGKILAFDFLVTTPATTAAKASTLTLRSAGLAMTGGSLALTSANATPNGADVAASSVGANQSSIQTLTISATGGTFAITVLGQTALAQPALVTAAALQTAIQGLSSVGAGNALVTGGPGNSAPLVITFAGTLANQPITAITTDPALLTGGAGTAAVVQTQVGSRSAFAANDIISVVAASTTAFIEGAGILRLMVLKS